MTDTVAAAAAARADAAFEATVDRLGRYLAVPAISCDAAHHDDVRRLAATVRDDLEALGLQEARILELDGALPVVVAQWFEAGDDRPTVVIYGHLDLQPVAGEAWTHPPHQATRVGDRLYARGSADDMGGWVSHLAAFEAWRAETGSVPCNLRLIIEGEEEIGSPNLERYMDAWPEAFDGDVMILTDCENPSTDVPGLTVSLRGLLEVELVCEAISADVHSGLWGGMVPDVSLALVKLIDRLIDDDGRMRVGRVAVEPKRRESAGAVVIDEATIRKGAHLIDGVPPLPTRDRTAGEWMWLQPSVTVIATTLPTPAQKKNALRRKASATLSVRLAPGQGPDEMKAALRDVLLVDPPFGVKVELIDGPWAGAGWLYEPKGPAFAAADRAYVKSWGCPMAHIGVGGSIPFVAMFSDRFADLPLILNGVMDPETTAHGPDESLHLGVFRKAIAANVYLIDELSRVGKAALKAG